MLNSDKQRNMMVNRARFIHVCSLANLRAVNRHWTQSARPGASRAKWTKCCGRTETCRDDYKPWRTTRSHEVRLAPTCWPWRAKMKTMAPSGNCRRAEMITQVLTWVVLSVMSSRTTWKPHVSIGGPITTIVTSPSPARR